MRRQNGLAPSLCPLGRLHGGRAQSRAGAGAIETRACAGIGEEDPFRDVTVKDVRRLGY